VRLGSLLLAGSVLCLTGCAVTMGNHAPSMDTTVVLRDANLPALNVGEFRLASGVDPALDRSISSRGNPIHPPGGNSFSAYLRDSLLGDLKTAGKYDPKAAVAVEGELTENSLSTGVAQGHATLAARFKVVRGDNVLYSKELRQEDRWDSSFIGAVAIPDAINHYTAQYGQLLNQLYKDEEFRTAASGR
jgi:hypothetical protein